MVRISVKIVTFWKQQGFKANYNKCHGKWQNMNLFSYKMIIMLKIKIFQKVDQIHQWQWIAIDNSMKSLCPALLGMNTIQMSRKHLIWLEICCHTVHTGLAPECIRICMPFQIAYDFLLWFIKIYVRIVLCQSLYL